MAVLTLLRDGAPSDGTVRDALDAPFETHGRLPLAPLVKRLGVTALLVSARVFIVGEASARYETHGDG